MVKYENGASRSERALNYHYINPEFLRMIGEAMTEGGDTKGAYNYRGGGDRYIEATYNHLLEHILCILSDPDNVREHIGHAAANLNMLAYFLERDGYLGVLALAGSTSAEDFGDFPTPVVSEIPKGYFVHETGQMEPPFPENDEIPKTESSNKTLLNALKEQFFGGKADGTTPS